MVVAEATLNRTRLTDRVELCPDIVTQYSGHNNFWKWGVSVQILVPDYYKAFKCIADKCKLNCCIGWEIDIDEDTLSIYDSIGGDFGKRLKDNISLGDCPHFILAKDERCPFLNERGLCDIITELGDGALCDICADHPRYRNYFSNRVEMGLGLCCEEAARIILLNPDKVKLIDIDSGETVTPFSEREKVISVLQDRSLPFYDRLKAVKEIGDKDYSSLLSSLERLDSEWDKYIELLKTDTVDTLSEWDTVFEQLAVYFVLRHTAEDLNGGILFSAFSVCIIRKICSALKSQNGALSFSDIQNICRMYSAEIEYSDENIEKIIDAIS